jgi:hypothetical protein
MHDRIEADTYLVMLVFSKSKDDIGIWADFSNGVLELHRVFHQKPEFSIDAADQHYISRTKWITLNILSKHQIAAFCESQRKSCCKMKFQSRRSSFPFPVAFAELCDFSHINAFGL